MQMTGVILHTIEKKVITKPAENTILLFPLKCHMIDGMKNAAGVRKEFSNQNKHKFKINILTTQQPTISESI